MFAFEFLLSLAANANLQPKSHESARSSKYPGESTEQVDTAPRAPTIGSSRLASRSSISSVATIDSSRRATANLFVLDRYQQKKYEGEWPVRRGLNDMTSLTALISKWPLVRQIREGKDGTGLESMSAQTRAMHARIDDAQVARSVCPYCGVGCGQLIYHKNGKLVSIEGDPESPISQGNLCPKGAASYQLLTHSRRETKMKYRPPRAKEWTEISVDRAMDMVADRIWESRKRTFVHKQNGATINHTTAICHLGGATLDNEENYLIKKLFTLGLGMVCISNQARI